LCANTLCYRNIFASNAASEIFRNKKLRASRSSLTQIELMTTTPHILPVETIVRLADLYRGFCAATNCEYREREYCSRTQS
jgi:hypothetical protein